MGILLCSMVTMSLIQPIASFASSPGLRGFGFRRRWPASQVLHFPLAASAPVPAAMASDGPGWPTLPLPEEVHLLQTYCVPAVPYDAETVEKEFTSLHTPTASKQL